MIPNRPTQERITIFNTGALLREKIKLPPSGMFFRDLPSHGLIKDFSAVKLDQVISLAFDEHHIAMTDPILQQMQKEHIEQCAAKLNADIYMVDNGHRQLIFLSKKENL